MKRTIALILVVMCFLVGCGQTKTDGSETSENFEAKMQSLIDIHGQSLSDSIDAVSAAYEEDGAAYSSIASSNLPKDTKDFLTSITVSEYKVLDDGTVACQMDEEGVIYGFYYSPNGAPKLINMTNSNDFAADYYVFTTYDKKQDVYYWNSAEGDKDWYYTTELAEKWYFWQLTPKN